MGRYAAVVTELIARLEYQSATGQARILDGMKFRPIPEVQADGLKDFPNSMLFVPSISEAFHARDILDGTMRLNVAVSTDRKEGIPALLIWVEKVLDAIETNRTTGLVDPNLGGTSRPFTTEVGSASALDLSYTALITITAMPKPMTRGQRRNS